MMNHQRNPKLKQPVFFKNIMVMKHQKTNKKTRELCQIKGAERDRYDPRPEKGHCWGNWRKLNTVY